MPRESSGKLAAQSLSLKLEAHGLDSQITVSKYFIADCPKVGKERTDRLAAVALFQCSAFCEKGIAVCYLSQDHQQEARSTHRLITISGPDSSSIHSNCAPSKSSFFRIVIDFYFSENLHEDGRLE